MIMNVSDPADLQLTCLNFDSILITVNYQLTVNNKDLRKSLSWSAML
jgi:hypothetical protein